MAWSIYGSRYPEANSDFVNKLNTNIINNNKAMYEGITFPESQQLSFGQRFNQAFANGLNTFGDGVVSTVKGTGSVLDSAWKGLTHTQKQNDYFNMNLANNGTQRVGMDQLYNFTQQQGTFNGTYADFLKDRDSRQANADLYAIQNGGELKDGSMGSFGTEMTSQFDATKALGSAQNLLNMGAAGWGLYESINSYGERKNLLKKQKELLEQQIEQNKENMSHTRAERQRQTKMRSNVAAQRQSSSAVSDF